MSSVILEGTRPAEILSSARAALSRAKDHLLGLQSDEGWWKGELETNVTMDAEDVMLRTFLGMRDDAEFARAANWIRSHQRPDGTWATFFGGPGDLSTTVEAYVALRIAGDPATDPHMREAAAFVRRSGGLESSRVFTRIWLALFGLWSWDELPTMPPELIFLPASAPFSIYEFGCWARQTVVALTIVGAQRPVRPLPFPIDELRTGVIPPQTPPSLSDWKGRFSLIDAVLKRYERLAHRNGIASLIRRVALARAEAWVVRRQEADGSWGGIQPPWVYSILALVLRGYPLDHPLVAKAFDGIESFIVRDGDTRRLEACQSPVWDTALAIIALSDAGLGPSDARLRRAGDWLLDEEVSVRGDWAARRAGLAPGGWAFEFENDNYPDVDDTAEVILALRRVALSDQEHVEQAIARGITWTKGMVSEEGAWGAFDADNLLEILYELPFSDFGAVIDPPSADVTAHAVEMLAHERGGTDDHMARGVAWLLAEQESDGAWFGRWGVNYVYGVGAVVPALVAAGFDLKHEAITKAVQFLETHQNIDGGWGEDIRSYDDPSLRGQGASTASQTAWALMALVSAGQADSPAAHSGVRFLLDTQTEDGTWDEPWYTGTGFPGDFYLNYHLYRLVFPISALGRWCAALGVDLGQSHLRSLARDAR